MYIYSFFLFITSLSVLCIGVKNCRNSFYNRKEYEDLCFILRIDDDYDFYEHHYFLQYVNMEIKNNYKSKKKTY